MEGDERGVLPDRVSVSFGARLYPAAGQLLLPAWRLTGRAGYAFFAGVLYSLTSPSQLFAPDREFAWEAAVGWRRMYVQLGWDEMPHLAGLVLLPLAILFLARAFRTGRYSWSLAAIFTIAAGSLATSFFPVDIAIAAVCLWFVQPRETLPRAILLTAGIGVASWSLAAPFYSPSLLHAIRAAADHSYEGRWTPGSWTALALFLVGWSVVWQLASRWTKEWQLRFFALFAYAMIAIPAIDSHLDRFFLPQAKRYKEELVIGFVLLIVFALRPWIDRLPRSVRVPLILLGLALAGEQIINYRIHAKELLRPAEVTRTIEYRASDWAARNLPDVRVMMPGSIAQWTNTYTDLQQFSGGSWSTAYNQTQQRAREAVAESDAATALLWLQAFGAGAVTVSGPKSEEFWKPYTNPAKFEGLLPVLWRQDDVAIYGVPQRSASLAHVVPESAIVSRVPDRAGDAGPLQPYANALNNANAPLAALTWEGRNRVRIAVPPAPGQVLSIQINHHPGWHATVAGVSREILRDGLGLMWLRPACNGACEVILEYDGGWELRLCRWLSAVVLLGLLAMAVRGALRTLRT